MSNMVDNTISSREVTALAHESASNNTRAFFHRRGVLEHKELLTP
jgi:hypothetical protein